MKKPTLTGEKIVLRPITAKQDAEAMFAALSDEEGMRLTGTQAEFTLEQVEAFCKRIETADDRYDFAITQKDDSDSAYVGEVVLNDIDDENRSASFRIALGGPEFYGKGLGTEATRLIVDFGFSQLNLHRIELEVYDFNPRAQHVYEKIGFQKEG
ncbi:MAG: GNAT family protein, partial [Chloroflexota bacterium]